jgi:hypothetical protein
MSEQTNDVKQNGRKPMQNTSTAAPDDVLLAMLEEVLAKLQAAGWVAVKLTGKSSTGRAWVYTCITGREEAHKPAIGTDRNGIITLNGLPVTGIKQ